MCAALGTAFRRDVCYEPVSGKCTCIVLERGGGFLRLTKLGDSRLVGALGRWDERGRVEVGHFALL